MNRRASNSYRPSVSRPGVGGLRFGMVALCVIRDSDPGLNKGKAKALYALLVSYADITSRNTAQGYPYRSALADALDCTKDTVDNATRYLEQDMGLITVKHNKVPGAPAENDANEYQVYDQWLIHGCEPTPDTPPQLVARYGPTVPGFDVDAWIAQHAPSFDLAGWRAAYELKLREQEAKREEQRQKEVRRRKPAKRGGGGTHSATPGGTHSATGGGTCAALSKDAGQDPSSKDEQAPSARSAGDVRRTGDVGSAHDANSGSAAPDKTGSMSDAKADVPGPRAAAEPKPRLSKEHAAAVRSVEAGLPAALVALLPYRHIPGRNRPAVLVALDSRTPQQLAARADRRWRAYGYEDALLAGELRTAVGVALELIAPTPYCPDPSCEDGLMIDTDAVCRACVERRRDRRAARLAGETVPTGRAATSTPARPECHDCGYPFAGAAPEDGVCGTCRDEAAAAADPERAPAEMRAVLAEWDRIDAEREQQAADEAARAADEAARAEQEQQRRDAADEARRKADMDLRASIAQKFPELTTWTPEPQPATAPF